MKHFKQQFLDNI